MRWRCNTARDVKMLIKYFRPSELGLLAAIAHRLPRKALEDVAASQARYDSGLVSAAHREQILMGRNPVEV